MAHYVKNQPGYSKVEYDRDKVRAAAQRIKRARKQPTSIALEPAMIQSLKREAEARGLPYQVLMRMLIVEGLRKLRKAS